VQVAVDVEPVAVNSGSGTIRLQDRGNDQPLAIIVRNQRQLFGAQEAWRRHLDTCPYRMYRQAKGRREH